MKKIFVSTLAILIYLSCISQTSNLTASDHNLLVKSILDNRKEVLKDKALFTSFTGGNLLQILSTRNYIPKEIRNKLSKYNVTNTSGSETLSKEDSKLYRELCQEVRKPSTAIEKEKMLRKYQNKFNSKKLNVAVNFSIDILREGQKDIYNLKYYQDNGILPGASSTATAKKISELVGDDVGGAVAGVAGVFQAVGATTPPTPVTLPACAIAGALGAVVTSAVSAITGISAWVTSDDEQHLPIDEGLTNWLNQVNNMNTCEKPEGSNPPDGSSNPPGNKDVKGYYDSQFQRKDASIAILGLRRYNGINKGCFTIIPTCICFKAPCPCSQEICVNSFDILAVERTGYKDKKGNYINEFSFKSDTKINIGGKSVSLKSYVENNFNNK